MDEVVTVFWKAVTPSFNIETDSMTEIFKPGAALP